jgi:excisionase family DNA binding protein
MQQSEPVNGAALLNVSQVSKLMSTSEDTVRGWARNGHFGAYKSGREYVFPQEKLDMLSVDDVALWLNLNVQTIRRWAREGLYPTIKLGRRYYFSRKVLVAGLHEVEAEHA